MANVAGVQVIGIGGALSGGFIDFVWTYCHGPVPHLRIRIYYKSRTQTTWKLLIARENTGDYYMYPTVEAPNTTGGSASLHYPPPNPIPSPIKLKFVFDSCIPTIKADTIEWELKQG